ncbi:MAG: hypothetical protein AAF773_16975 [Cyanobacteria bacterium P01_D01_bin.115]
MKRNADGVTALSNVNRKDIGKRLARVGTAQGVTAQPLVLLIRP